VIINMSKALTRKMAEAATYQEWQEAAQAYDERNGLQRWKQSKKSRRHGPREPLSKSQIWYQTANR